MDCNVREHFRTLTSIICQAADGSTCYNLRGGLESCAVISEASTNGGGNRGRDVGDDRHDTVEIQEHKNLERSSNPDIHIRDKPKTQIKTNRRKHIGYEPIKKEKKNSS